MFRKTFTIKFSYYDSVTNVFKKHQRRVSKEDFEMRFADEFVNVVFQQLCAEYNLTYEDFSTPDDESKQYRIGWYVNEENNEIKVTICLPDEKQFLNLIEKNYMGCTYTFMSSIYYNYYNIDLKRLKDKTLITFNDELINVIFGTFKDIKEEKDGNNMGPSYLYC